MRWNATFPLLCASLLIGVTAAQAHPPPPVRASMEFPEPMAYQLTISCDVAALVMQAPQGHLGEAGARELRELPDSELEGWIADAKRALADGLSLTFDEQAGPPIQVEFPGPDRMRRSARAHHVDETSEKIVVRGPVPEGARFFRIAFPADLGPVLLTVRRPGRPPFTVSLGARQTSSPLPLTDNAEPPGRGGGAVSYFVLGLQHILEGPDHILFVLGLFLLSPRLWPLFWQVSAFSLAHSLTLGLSACGIWSLPSWVVEPIIALSVVAIAVEDLVTNRLHAWRPVLVFAFGLLHGLGFAGALGETGLPEGHRLAALAAFNVGVEAGQLAVLAAAFLLVGWFRERPWYRRRVVIPAASLFVIVGLYWTVDRIIN